MVEGRQNGERRVAGPLLAVAVLIIGLVTAATVAAGLRSAQRDKADQVMDQRHAMALGAVQGEISRYRALLESLAAGSSTDDDLTWDDFDVASSPLADARLIGAAAVAYVVPVRTEEIPAAERLWRARGASGLRLRPQGDAEEHYFPIFIRALSDTGTPTSGTDLRAATELTDVLDDARRIHTTAVSDTYFLLQDRDVPAGQRQQSFVFATPIWTRANIPEFRGWMVLALRGQDFLAQILDTASQGQLSGSLIAHNSDGSQVTIVDRPVAGEPDLVRDDEFAMGERYWTLVTRADTGRLPGAGSHLPAIALALGSALSLLLAWLVFVLATGRARARTQVEIATGELRAAEERSRRQAGLLGAVLSSISDGVSMVDDTGRFLLQNPAAKRLLGINDDNDQPEQWQQHYGMFRPDGKTPFPLDEMPLIRALRGEPADGVEAVIRNPARPDGVLISIDGRPLDVSAGQHGAVAVFRDITALRRYETDLSIFAGVVAHDLKAPLAVARGHAELALDDLPEDADARDSVRRIVQVVDRMDTLIETLLAYTTARHAPLRLTAVDLSALVRDVVQERVAHLRDDQPAPQVTVGPLPPVQADPGMLRHVLDNLVGNALKYVRPGTVPQVSVTASAEADGRVRIEIADSGIGIPDAEKPRIFDSFHRTEEAAGYAGTGLGLAICQRILERHGSDIGVADNPGGGTRFHFTLPAAILPPVPDPVEESIVTSSSADPAASAASPDAAASVAGSASAAAASAAGSADSDTSADDEAVRAALERALAERAAIMNAAQLPGMGGPPPSLEESEIWRHARAHGRD
ncbi:ATP-binding protein [Actinoplanes sp. NBC_00393]|uniref:ATP-binding protein n=1 Tax=Actinoplanes sp. NBC_00393 TaxID=2975953 RepID=UPI002E2147CB